MFKLQTDVILYLIYFLEKEKEKGNNHQTVNLVINKLKKSFYNHETNNSRILAHLNKITDTPDIPLAFKSALNTLKIKLVITDKATPQEIYLNPLRRQVESLLAIKLLVNPTTMMMQSVGNVSNKIIEILQKYEQLSHKEQKRIQVFLSALQHLVGDSKYNSVISLGAFSSRPKINEVIAILAENDAKKLPMIMHIHFKFTLYALRSIRLDNTADAKLSGAVKDIIEKHYGSCQKYIKKLSESSQAGHVARHLLADKIICNSSIYTVDPTRGRLKTTAYLLTNTLGLLRLEQDSYEHNFPNEQLGWSADAKTLTPNFDSSVVKKAIIHEAVYVGGPSGMSALLLHLMENLGRFSQLKDKQLYLAAINAYVVGGGFHSIDEVLSPAQYCLALLPGYNTPVPDGTEKSYKDPPNTAVFYETLSKIGGKFSQRIDSAWHDFIAFHDNFPHFLNGENQKPDKIMAKL